MPKATRFPGILSAGLTTDPPGAGVYQILGVRPFINCDGVRTAHGGSVMLPDVRAAMEQAASHFVNLDELMDAAARRIAKLTGAQWGVVTCGSSAAMSLATAACVAGNDPVRMLRLPFTQGWVNRVIMVSGQRFAYEQAIRMVGTTIIEVRTIAELDKALADRVAMIAILGTHEEVSPIRLEEIVARAKPCKVPVLVDAASEHIARPIPWLSRGADLAVYSGGKYLRGPQTSGFLLGRRDLVEAAWRNASPHQAFGRPMKVSKECIVGALAALEHWFEKRDAAAEEQRWHSDLQMIADRLAGITGVSTEIIAAHGAQLVPRLRVRWDRLRIGLQGESLRQDLLAGEPRIMLKDRTVTASSIEIDPFSLQHGEAAMVGEVLAAVFVASGKPVPDQHMSAWPDVAGEWQVWVTFLRGARTHRLWLEQKEAIVNGKQISAQFRGPVRGSFDGRGIHLNFRMRYEGSIISYQLDGEVTGDQMEGKVILGSALDQSEGPINLSQFGRARWRAVRIAKRAVG